MESLVRFIKLFRLLWLTTHPSNLIGKVNSIDNADPLLNRLNKMAIQFIAEKLPNVSKEWMRKGIQVICMIEVIIFPRTVFGSMKKWIFIALAVLTVYLWESLNLRNHIQIILLISICTLFGKRLIFHTLRIIFSALDSLCSGALMVRILDSCSRGQKLGQVLLHNQSPVFGLLGTYAELMDHADRIFYHDRIMQSYWEYKKNNDLEQFESFEREFWSFRQH